LALELVGKLTFGVTGNDHCLLVAAHFGLQQFLEFLIFLEKSLDFLLQFIAVKRPLVLLPALLLEIALQLTLTIAPLLFLLSELLLPALTQIPLLFSLSLAVFPLVFPLEF
jgi:hypothetical protein